MRHHVATDKWLADVAALVATGGYDLREGIAVSVAMQPGFEEAEAEARARLCALLGVRSVPHSLRTPDAKDLIRASVTQILERIVYDSRHTLGAGHGDGPGSSVGAGGDVGGDDAPAVILSVLQAERAIARLRSQGQQQQQQQQRQQQDAPGASSTASASAAVAAAVAAGSDCDARLLVAAVSDAVLQDFRRPLAAPLLAADAGTGAGASLIVPVALHEASPHAPFPMGQDALRRIQAGSKRSREAGGAGSAAAAAATAAAAAAAAAAEGPLIDVVTSCRSAVVSLGTVDATCDYRPLFATGAVGGRYAGDLALVAAGGGGGDGGGGGGGGGCSHLRRLLVNQSSSLHLSIAVDASPPGLIGAGAEGRAPRVALVTASLQRGSFFLKGRYCKFRRGLSQTPWFVEGQRKQSSQAPSAASNAAAAAAAGGNGGGGGDGGGGGGGGGGSGGDGAVIAAAPGAGQGQGGAGDTSVEELLGAPIADAFALWGGRGCAVGMLPADVAASAGAGAGGAAAVPAEALARVAPLARMAAAAPPPRFKFHAAGREDVDVRMLGPGRPYAIELIDARAALLPLAPLLRLHAAVNARAGGLLETTPLGPTSREEFARLSRGADSKRKTYTALVWSSAPHDAARLRALLDAHVADLALQQRTPVRVLHRRSLMVRRKVVHAARTDWLAPHFFLLHLVTSAGTYVKEFVHGDLGRTRPSVGELLGAGGGGGGGGSARVSADILSLDVTDLVEADGDEAGGEEDDEDDE